MARLPYPSRDEMPAELAARLNALPRNNVTEMVAHAQWLAEPFLRMIQAQFTKLELSDRQRELAILTVSGLVDCDYEFAQHVPMFETVGIDADLRDRVRGGDFEALQDPGERALLALVAAVVEGPRISDELFAAAQRHLSERQIVEVLQLVGFYWGLGRICTALELELDIPDDLTSITAISNINS
ncbi:MAG: carboxymuconolactone decarboxylase family protein [Mycobacterium sp.]